MRTRLLSLVLASTALALAAPSRADQMYTLVSQTRDVTASFSSSWEPQHNATNTVSAPDYSTFLQTIQVAINSAIAYQDTSVTASGMQGSLTSYATESAYNFYDDSAHMTGISSFVVQFQVPQTRGYTLTATLSGKAQADMSAANATAYVKLTGTAGTVAYWSTPNMAIGSGTSLFDHAPYSASGVLPAGTYTLTCYSYSQVLWNELAQSSVDFNLSVTPEPATLSLLAVGAVAILRRRR